MANRRQPTSLSRGPLFDERAYDAYEVQKRGEGLPDRERRVQALQQWCTALASARRAKEGSLETDFYKRVLGQVLGYEIFPNSGATLYVKPPKSLTGTPKVPDGVLGDDLSPGNWRPSAVLELKVPGTSFDAPQPRESHFSPVEQAFNYAESILGIRWVLVTDMRIIRMYSVDSRHEFLEFDLDQCSTDRDKFTMLYFMLGAEHLVRNGEASATTRLLEASRVNQKSIRASFYRAYALVREDLYKEIESACARSKITATKEGLLSATQRLLDRILFIRYCEDSPDALIARGTLKLVVDAAKNLPGRGASKVYTHLKLFFEEIDKGSDPESGIQVSAYNGELFKKHEILDAIDLPDVLATREYGGNLPQSKVKQRVIRGAWGFHEYDFWKEINEHLLGHIFEESLSDFVPTRGVSAEPERLRERKQKGIFYTSEILSNFLLTSALKSFLDDTVGPSLKRKPKDEKETLDILVRRHDELTKLRILDPACGSGAFLVSAYQGLLEEHWRTKEAMALLRGDKQTSLYDDHSRYDDRAAQAAMLRQCLYGADLLPQAVEIAKLALWIRSARKGEPVASLGENLIAADSFNVDGLFSRLDQSPGSFDLVIGNPPWGAQMSELQRRKACRALGLPIDDQLDSWEIFVALGLHALRPGGRLAFVLPDTLFSPEKASTRKMLLERTTIEKLHNLGPDWFGAGVRMGTVIIQARLGAAAPDDCFAALLLHGERRRRAIEGDIPLSQLEASLSRQIPQARSIVHPDYPLEMYRDVHDDVLMQRMDEGGDTLANVCTRARGEEMAKSGLLWRCPSCNSLANPGPKAKGGGFKPTNCKQCGLKLHAANVTEVFLITLIAPTVAAGAEPFIDGDDLPGRYKAVQASRWIKLDTGFQLKSAHIYRGPKILVRQAGVGVAATLDDSNARCPQSVYVYRVNPEHESWSNEYVLAVLLSRAMAYYVFKRFSEVDPARAHAKLTHERLASLPIPRLDLQNPRHAKLQRQIRADVRSLLAGSAALGGEVDWRIESAVRELYGLTAADGAHINHELKSLPRSQAITELFPENP